MLLKIKRGKPQRRHGHEWKPTWVSDESMNHKILTVCRAFGRGHKPTFRCLRIKRYITQDKLGHFHFYKMGNPLLARSLEITNLARSYGSNGRTIL